MLALIIHNVLKIALKTRKLMGSVFEIILEKACFRKIAAVAQKKQKSFTDVGWFEILCKVKSSEFLPLRKTK